MKQKKPKETTQPPAEEWRPSSERINKELAAQRQITTYPVFGIDLVRNGEVMTYGAVVVLEKPEWRDAAMAGLNAMSAEEANPGNTIQEVVRVKREYAKLLNNYQDLIRGNTDQRDISYGLYVDAEERRCQRG